MRVNPLRAGRGEESVRLQVLGADSNVATGGGAGLGLGR